PEMGQAVRRQSGHVAPLEGNAPAGGNDLAGDEVEERRLARAVGADDRMKGAGLDAQAHAVDGAERPEVARQRFGTQQRGVAHAPASGSAATPPGSFSPGSRRGRGPPAASRSRVNASTRPPRRKSTTSTRATPRMRGHRSQTTEIASDSHLKA